MNLLGTYDKHMNDMTISQITAGHAHDIKVANEAISYHIVKVQAIIHNTESAA